MSVFNLMSQNTTKISINPIRWLGKMLRVQPQNKAAVLKFMHEHFVYYEPLSKSLEMMKRPEDRNPGWDRYLSELIDEGTSIKYEEYGEVLGAMLCAVKNASKPYEKIETQDPKFRKILDFLIMIEAESDIYKKWQVNQYFYVDCVGIHKDHRRKGLPKKILDHVEVMGRESGCKALACITTNKYATMAAKRAGMTPLYSLNYEDYKIDGEIVFKTELPHKVLTVLAKNI